MGYVTVNFLDEEYQVSETINEFLSYDVLLEPMRKKLLEVMGAQMKSDAKYLVFSGDMPKNFQRIIGYCEDIVNGTAEIFVNKFFELGIYDVTKESFLDGCTTIEELTEYASGAMQRMLGEAQKFVDMKNAGLERAYNYASQGITGSGVRIFTSSVTALMIHSAVEKHILLSQAKKADKEYEEAVRTITATTRDNLDSMSRKVMVSEFYPIVLDTMLEFDQRATSRFLEIITDCGKFDFESVEQYNMRKAEDMLKNIGRVPDKKEFLKQAFLTCPFCIDVYEECLKYGLLDAKTFETAKYFGFADELAEKIDEEVKKNLKNTDKIAPMISLLALHRGTNEADIWKKIYEGTLGNIEGTYKIANAALSDKRKLDKFIRENISNIVTEIAKKSKEDVERSIDKKLSAILSEKQFAEFVSKGILAPETIRMSGSSAMELSAINTEIRNALTDCIMEYIEEANKRLDAYNEAMAIYEAELKVKNDELSALQAEKKDLGLFAFSKKKEMTAAIDAKAIEISEFKRIHEPKDLWAKAEAMYR